MDSKPAFVLAVALAATPAAAQISWYAGGNIGQSRTNDELVANRESTLVFAENVRTEFDAKDSAFKAFAGMRINRSIGLEIFYADLGSHRLNTTLQGGAPPLPAAILINRKIAGYGFDLVGTAPLGDERLELIGKVGTFRARIDATASLQGNIEFSGGSGERSRGTQRSEEVLHFGAGLQYWITPRIAVRAEYERFSSMGKPFVVGGQGTTGQADTDVAWIGVVARF